MHVKKSNFSVRMHNVKSTKVGVIRAAPWQADQLVLVVGRFHVQMCAPSSV